MINKEKEIQEAIKLLKANGYIVTYYDGIMVGQWIAFHQEGMSPVLHGRVLKTDGKGYYTVRCSNGEKRFVLKEDVLGCYTYKRECYDAWRN